MAVSILVRQTPQKTGLKPPATSPISVEREDSFSFRTHTGGRLPGGLLCLADEIGLQFDAIELPAHNRTNPR